MGGGVCLVVCRSSSCSPWGRRMGYEVGRLWYGVEVYCGKLATHVAKLAGITLATQVAQGDVRL